MLTSKKHMLRSVSMTAIMAFIVGQAFAADLPASSLAPIEDVPYEEMTEMVSGWYLRGDIGLALAQDPDIQTSTVSDNLVKYKDISTDQNATASLGFGYQFNSGFRMDATLDYTAPVRYTGKGWYDLESGGQLYRQNVNFQSRRVSAAAMLNAYYEFNNFDKFRPYIGAGIGIGWTDVYDVRYNDIMVDSFAARNMVPIRKNSRSHEQFTFAWSLMAGIAYQLTTNMDLDVGYRYMNYGDVRSGGMTVVDYRPTVSGHPNSNFGYNRFFNNYSRLDNLGEHQIRVGLRYKIDQ